MAIDWTYWPSSGYWDNEHADWRAPWIRPARPTTIRWESQMTVPPADEPISVAIARNYSKLDTGDDDELVEFLLMAARQRVEDETALALMTQTWQLLLDRWPSQGRMEYWPEPTPRLGDMFLPRWPVQSITSIQYTDSAGNLAVVPTTVYGLDSASQPARVFLKYGQSWPASPALAGGPAVVVTFVAGSVTLAAIDARARLAILRLYSHYYDNRTEIVVDQRIRAVSIPEGAQKLIDQLSIGAMVA